jgi:hypothetical protein
MDEPRMSQCNHGRIVQMNYGHPSGCCCIADGVDSILSNHEDLQSGPLEYQAQ